MNLKTLIRFALIFGFILLPIISANAANSDQVNAAIETAKAKLYSMQKGGNWETTALADLDKGPASPEGGQWGGLTSIATYALLAAGESPSEPRIKAAIEWLKKADIKGVYALGLRLQVWHYLCRKHKDEARPFIERDAKLLLLALNSKGDAMGFYHYLVTPTGSYDHSVSQYGILGIWAAAEAEQPFEVPSKFWDLVENAWLKDQHKDGAWGYNGKRENPTMTMTAAGVATLYITQDYVHGMEGLTCKGNIRNKGIEAGIDWMSKHFKEVGNNLYGWYGIERIGVASGLKYFGTIDWYREGCNIIVPQAGNWNNHGTVPGTSFALLFLVRGRAPVVMSKLNYELDSHGDKMKEAHWNQRPRDAANVTQYISRESENFYNWQIINLKVPSEELHDSPIMYIAGDQTLDLKKEDVDKLRAYVEQGGLLVFNSDCVNANFQNSILKGTPGKPGLAAQLWPDYEVRKLPEDHLIYTGQTYKKKDWKDKLDLMGVGNGTREFMLFFNGGDPARFWQTKTIGGKEAYHQLMANIFLYTTEQKPPRFKGQSYIVTKNIAIKSTRTVKMARVEYAGRWNPEPGGWRRFAAFMHNTEKVDLQIDPVRLGEGKLTAANYKIAHITGNTKFRMTDKEKAEIKAYTESGGVLIIDACGGEGEFAASAEAELGAIFGEAAKEMSQPLSFDNALYSSPKISEVSYRRTAQKQVVGKLKAPQISTISRNGKPVVYFSRYDMSTGLVGQEVDGVVGYTAISATELMRNLVLFGSGTPAAPPEAPKAAAVAPQPAKPAAPKAAAKKPAK